MDSRSKFTKLLKKKNVIEISLAPTALLVKKVPYRVFHEDDLEVGVVALGGGLVLHLQILDLAFLQIKNADRHVHFVADETESQGIQLLQNFQQPLEPVGNPVDFP